MPYRLVFFPSEPFAVPSPKMPRQPFETEKYARAVASEFAHSFKRHGYDGDRDFYWAREDLPDNMHRLMSWTVERVA